MPFKARAVYGEKTPVRLYIHDAGFEEAFGSMNAAKKYFLETFRENRKNRILLPEDAEFNWYIAALWGDGKTKVAEINHCWVDNWPGHYERLCYVFENGLYQPKPKSVSCDETDIIIGEEARHRLKTKNLDEYMKNPPDLQEMNEILHERRF